jgi:hypothetical protein
VTAVTTKEAYLSVAEPLEVAGKGFKVTAKGSEGATFTVERNPAGEINRTCAPESRNRVPERMVHFTFS